MRQRAAELSGSRQPSLLFQPGRSREAMMRPKEKIEGKGKGGPRSRGRGRCRARRQVAKALRDARTRCSMESMAYHPKIGSSVSHHISTSLVGGYGGTPFRSGRSQPRQGSRESMSHPHMLEPRLGMFQKTPIWSHQSPVQMHQEASSSYSNRREIAFHCSR